MAVVMLISGLAQTAGQQASALTVQLAPAANATMQTWSLVGNQIIAAGDQLSQAVQNAGQAGNTADPGGLDPNKWGSKQEQIMRQSLAGDYQQVYGASDVEIRRGLGIQGKVADFVGYNSQQGRWLIAESKGSDMYKAVQQLQNTMQGVINKTGATASNVDLRIYTSSSNMQRLLGSDIGLGGYRVREGFLGYINESGQWVWELINGVRVSVQVNP